jgi:hypothetical protein
MTLDVSDRSIHGLEFESGSHPFDLFDLFDELRACGSFRAGSPLLVFSMSKN